MENASSATPVDCIVMPRVVNAGHGHEAAMGYKYRCRMESRQRATWFGFGPQVTEYRFVLERHFMSWQDEFSSAWGNLSATHMAAVDLLDRIASKPSDQKGVTYVS